MRMERVPLESSRPVIGLAAVRIALSTIAVAAAGVAVISGEDEAKPVLVFLGAVALPWSIFTLVLAQRAPRISMSPFLAVGDLVVLATSEALLPAIYGPVRSITLLLIVAHAYFQGAGMGTLIAAVGVTMLVPIAALSDGPHEGGRLVIYEVVFASAALCAAVLVGRLRAAESTGRLRQRGLSRRSIEAEDRIRRSLAESIHDGPVQELVSLELMLSAAGTATDKGDLEHAREILQECRHLAGRNIQALRDEIVGLGPQAFEELSFESAIEQCVPMWRRRYSLDVRLEMDRMDLSSEVAGGLFRIAQEAVANAGRHAEARSVTVRLGRSNGAVELRITDDGKGFGTTDPLGSGEPGHIGLASMRERAELLDGEIAIDSDDGGTEVRVRVLSARSRL